MDKLIQILGVVITQYVRVRGVHEHPQCSGIYESMLKYFCDDEKLDGSGEVICSRTDCLA